VRGDAAATAPRAAACAWPPSFLLGQSTVRRYINVDEGWLQSRAPNGTIVEDFVKFPSGMKGFGDWVRASGAGLGARALAAAHSLIASRCFHPLLGAHG